MSRQGAALGVRHLRVGRGARGGRCVFPWGTDPSAGGPASTQQNKENNRNERRQDQADEHPSNRAAPALARHARRKEDNDPKDEPKKEEGKDQSDQGNARAIVHETAVCAKSFSAG